MHTPQPGAVSSRRRCWQNRMRRGQGALPHHGRMEAQATKVAELLHEAAETHHRVYRIVDGDDDDWATWYGDWLVRLSELPQLLDRQPVRSELVYLLVGLDKEYVQRTPAETWESYYARRIVEHFSEPGAR